MHRADDAANFSIVKPDGLAGLGVIEHLRQRNANLGGRDELSRFAVRARPSEGAPPAQDEYIAWLEEQRLRE